MCEFSRKLTAWLDRELPVEETLEVELHLGACAECQHEVRRYERLSGALDAYCDATLESSAPRGELRWKPAVLGAGAVAAVLTLVLASPHARVTQLPAAVAQAQVSASSVATGTPAPLNSVVPSPQRRVNLPSINAREKRDSWANSTPRFTESVLREQSASAMSVPATPAAAVWRSAEPAIQITIPADAVLPPGAAPEGVSFVAEVSIAADGSAHQIFLQP